MLGTMLCSHHLEIHNSFERGDLCFRFALGSTAYTAGPARARGTDTMAEHNQSQEGGAGEGGDLVFLTSSFYG